MSNVTVSREVAAPVSQVWKALDDFGGIHHFSAGVESSPIMDGTPSHGVGSERHCVLYDGNHIKERVIEAIEEEKLGIEILDTSMPLKSGGGSFVLTPTASGRTKITMEMNYVVKFGPIGLVMDALMLNRMMTKNLGNLLASLDHHLQTGEDIPAGWKAAA